MTEPAFKVLITADAVGGVWQYSTDLARGLSGIGIETVLVVLGPPPTRRQASQAEAVPGLTLVETDLVLDWMAEDASGVEAAGKALALLAEQHDVDLVQLNAPAIAAVADFPVPVVGVQHSCVGTWWDAVHGTELPADFAWRTELVRAGLHKANVVVTPTDAFGLATRRRYELPQVPKTVHNGRKPFKLPRRPQRDFAFTAGRLWDQGKNLATLDASAGRMAVPIHAAGPVRGPNGASVMFEHLHCVGSLGEEGLARWLAAKPVFVSSALYEPFGLAVLEAATAGCPLILSDIPTFRELWDGAALFVPPRDEGAFALAIGNLVNDEFGREMMGKAASERAARFTPEAMAAQMAAIYRALLPAVQRPVLAARAAA